MFRELVDAAQDFEGGKAGEDDLDKGLALLMAETAGSTGDNGLAKAIEASMLNKSCSPYLAHNSLSIP